MDRAFETADWSRNWTAPDGLCSSAPRCVGLTGKGKAVLVSAIFMFAASIAAGVGLGLVAVRDAASARQFREHAVITDAVADRKWKTQGDSSRRWISYSFSAEGREYQGRARMPRTAWQSLQPGSRLRVGYMPSSPQQNRPVDSDTDSMPPWVPALIAIQFAVVGAGMKWQIGRQRRLLEEGWAAEARVTGHEKAQRGSHGGELGKKYRYCFRLLSGELREGKAGPLKNPPAVGSRITVIYNPDNPRRNVPYPFLLVKTL